MAHTIEDKIIELADKYTLNHSNESYLNNKAMLEEFLAYVKLELYGAGQNYIVSVVSDIINKPENDYLVLQELKETILKLKKTTVVNKNQLKKKIVAMQETLLPNEFLVRCYEDNQLCYRNGEVYVAELVEQPNIIKHLFPQYSDKLLKVWYHGSTIRDGKREGIYNDIFVSPFQRGNIFAIGNFERIS